MDAFSPSDQEFLEEARGDLPMVKAASWVVGFLGAVYLLIGVGTGLLYGGLGLAAEGDEAIGLIVGGVAMFVCVALMSVPMLAAAVGLRQGRMWAWVITVCVGGMFAMSACMPFGVFLLYAMLSQDVRKAFLE